MAHPKKRKKALGAIKVIGKHYGGLEQGESLRSLLTRAKAIANELKTQVLVEYKADIFRVAPSSSVDAMMREAMRPRFEGDRRGRVVGPDTHDEPWRKGMRQDAIVEDYNEQARIERHILVAKLKAEKANV